MSVGAASVLAMYSYGGYNQVCSIGEEIKDPTRTIPRSIVFSTLLVAALYILMTVVILGMIPWQEVGTRGPWPRSSSRAPSRIRRRATARRS